MVGLPGRPYPVYILTPLKSLYRLIADVKECI
jgi:hypothetical protein